MLGPDDLVVTGRGFAVGDEILTSRNDYRLGVLNGTRGVITDIDYNRGELRINTDGRDVVLPPSYVATGHLTHAYAVTIHKAQGLTVATRSSSPTTPSTANTPTPGCHGAPTATGSTHRPADERAEERHGPEPANDAVA